MFPSFTWLRNALAELSAPEPDAYFAIEGEGPNRSLCAPQTSFSSLVDAVVGIAAANDLTIVYMVDGQRTQAVDDEQLRQALSERPSTRVHLKSDDDRLTFFLEQWRQIDRVLVAPRTNPFTMKLYLDDPTAQSFLEQPGKSLRELYSLPIADDCTFDVDVVYTWVDSNDHEWSQMLSQHLESTANTEPETADDSLFDDRFTDRDELRYSLRSLLTYAPWVRTVHVVSNCAPPDWFDDSNERVRWVHHEAIIEAKHLPTFNSHAIETAIHRVPDLAEHFLYFNDDIFLVKPVSKSDFFVSNGLAKTRPDPFGSLQGEVNAADPDYVNAARNGQKLLEAEFEKTVTRFHTHSPQSMRQSVAHACEQTFAAEYQRTRGSRFRAATDISPTSFLYPHFAYLTGAAVADFPKTALVNANKPYRELFASHVDAMALKRYNQLPLTLCINDGGGSARIDDWGTAIVDFMTSAYPQPCEAEKPD